MAAGDVIVGTVELLGGGLLVLGAIALLVHRGTRISTPREGGGTQAHQQAVRSALGSGTASGPGTG